MPLVYNAEQEELRQTVSRFMSEQAPESKVRSWMESETGFDLSVWKRLTDEMGLAGLLVPTAQGGAGGGPGELMAVFEETGRCLFGAPLLSSGVLAATALVFSGDPAADVELLARIADGSCIATLADRDYWVDGAEATVTARLEGEQWVLGGLARHVLDAQSADVLLVPVRGSEGDSLFAVGSEDLGSRVHPLVTLDQTRKQADVDLEACPARPVGTVGGAGPAVGRALAFGALAVAAEAVGGAERALELSVQHASQRIQFGRVIGEFQAIKHKCADMKLKLESARAAVHNAADALSASSTGIPIELSVAKVWACDAFFEIAADTIQIHGGMGCTWEHPAHLYLRRAKTLQHLLGSRSHHRAAVARHLRLLGELGG